LKLPPEKRKQFDSAVLSAGRDVLKTLESDQTGEEADSVEDMRKQEPVSRIGLMRFASAGKGAAGSLPQGTNTQEHIDTLRDEWAE
jgi:hypothetical protein